MKLIHFSLISTKNNLNDKILNYIMYLIIIKIHQRRIISSNWRKMISQIIFNYEQLILTKEMIPDIIISINLLNVNQRYRMFIVNRDRFSKFLQFFLDSRQQRHATCEQTIRAHEWLSTQIFIRPIRNKLTYANLVYYTRCRRSTSNIQRRCASGKYKV